MASSTFVRLLSLLLLVLPAPLRDYYLPAASTDHAVDDELAPLVLVPGASCSELEARLTAEYRPSAPRCGAMKGNGWFGLWRNSSDLAARDYVACFMEQMSLVYHSDANEYRNVAGVETRVRNFGGATSGFYSDPLHPDWCLEPMRQALGRVGYRDGENLFGAPYDFRHVPPIPGLPSPVFSRYSNQLMSLIERIHDRHRRKVLLFGHSQGGMVALEFMRAAPPAWQEEHVQHLVVAAPLPLSPGFVYPVQNFVSGSGLLDVPAATALSLRPMWRTFESALLGFPSPAVFGGDTPVVVTGRRNYTARDMADLLADAGAGAAVEPFRRRLLPRVEEGAPNVPVTCMNGVGNDTPEQLLYRDADFDKDPEIVYGDGDNTINLASMLALDEDMRRHLGPTKRYKSIKLHGATHGGIITDEWSLKRVIHEILQAGSRI